MAELNRAQMHLRAGQKLVCDLCETESDTRLSKCLDCDLYICDKCTLTHKKVPATKGHQIIAHVERGSNTVSKISRMCQSHPSDEVSFYCSTCTVLICAECVLGNHRKHDCAKVKGVAIQKRQQMKSELNEVKSTKIPMMTSKVNKIDKDEKENDKKRQKNAQAINARKLKLISEIEQINKELVAECEAVHQNNKDKLTATKTQITQDLTELETFYTEYSEVLHIGSDIEVIMAEKEMADKLDKLKSSNIDTEVHLPSFIAGKTNHKSLQLSYGSIELGSVSIQRSSITDDKVISTFNCRSETVISICPLTDNTALIHYSESYDNDIVTADGQVQKTTKLDFMVYDFIMTSQGVIVATDDDNPTIHKLTKDGVKTGVISTAPLEPVCLCESSDGNILVSLVDKYSYEVDTSSRRLVARMTMSGKTVESYEYNEGSTTNRLFICPSSVSEKVNMDICVVNRISDTTGHLVILDNRGKLKYTYKGQQLDEPFDAGDVKCDKLGHIIVSDEYNYKVHMLDSDGQFIRYLITEDKLIDYPVSLAIDERDVLWVGGYGGNIYTIRYLT